MLGVSFFESDLFETERVMAEELFANKYSLDKWNFMR